MENTNRTPNWIHGVNNGMARMPISYANLILGNKANLFRLVSDEGFYLPNKESRCCTSRYLFDVMAGNVFRIKIQDVRVCLNWKVKWTKIDIIAYLEANYIRNQKFGFGVENLPDRPWITNILYTFNPEHEVFTGLGGVEKIVEIPIKYVKFIYF